MLPPPKSGKRALASFDEQLSRLRQTMALPTTQQLNAASSTGAALGSSKSSGTDARDGTSQRDELYGGTWRVTTAAVSFQDPSANWSDSWQYLRRARRERQEEFSALEEAFVYDEAEEVQRHEDAILSSEQPVFRYHHHHYHTAAAAPGAAACLRTAPTEFLCSNGTRRADALSAVRTSTSKAPSVDIAGSSLPPRRSSSSAPTEALRDLYDGVAALRTTGAAHEGRAMRSHLGILSSVSGGGGTSGLSGRSASADGDGSASVARSERSSVFCSEIVRRHGPTSSASSATGSTAPKRGAPPLSHVGSVVAHSSVDVHAHIHLGKQQGFANRGDEQRAEFSTTTASADVSYVFPSTGGPCVARIVHRGSIRFCRACGACTCVTASESTSTNCAKCGEPFISLMAPASSTEPRSGNDDGNESALRQMEALEALEARSFQEALMEWRNAGGGAAQESSDAAKRADYSQSTDLGIESSRSAAVQESVGSTPPVTWAGLLPKGSTYFSHLWDQMQGEHGSVAQRPAHRLGVR